MKTSLQEFVKSILKHIIQNYGKDKLKQGSVWEVFKFRFFLHIQSSRLNVTMFIAGLRQDHYPKRRKL